MKKYGFLLKNFVFIFLLLPLMAGCEKELKGYEKVVGTATINGENYKEATRWAWNYKAYPSDIGLYENYNVFHFLARLSPEKGNSPKHVIYFYGLENGKQLKLNHPYKLDFYEELHTESLFWSYVIPYFSEHSSEILAEGADGIAYVIRSDSDEAIPLKGEIIFEKIDSENICYGSYSLTSVGNGSKEIVINGKFETRYYVSIMEY